MCKTSILLKISIAALLFTLLVLRCGNDRSPEPESTPGYISYTLRWDSVIPGQAIPEKIRYCIYPSEGGPMIQTDGDRQGIKLCLPPDNYKVLIFNYDVKNIDFRHMGRFEEAEAYLKTTDTHALDPNGMIPLYRAVVQSLRITSGMDSTQVLTPVPLIQPLLLADKTIENAPVSLNLSGSGIISNTSSLFDEIKEDD